MTELKQKQYKESTYCENSSDTTTLASNYQKRIFADDNTTDGKEKSK